MTVENIIPISLEEAMPLNYLPYAIEVAKDRAIPDVRDGLKPVQRRILYGAYLLKAFPDRPYYKSARIVGDILGKFHPHGDSSVYDAMVVLAQNFTTRMPLIDGHGNWGSIDGDNAAAMRYTEARLTNIAMEMIRDLEMNTVDMQDNYSNNEKEPTVLPAKFPNLLVNGAFGIAVGLATNIPPHNLTETIEAVIAFIDNEDITIEELMNYIKGPDLPTGGLIIGQKALLSAYETGEGKATLRAKATIEKLENGRLAIVIKEFPYRKNKAKILETISNMTEDKKHAKSLELISDIRDESDRRGIRAVIELKKNIEKADAKKLLKYLYMKTDLQCSLSFNMVAIADGRPQTLNLKKIIYYYTEHQKNVLKRRTEKELQISKERFHIVEGFIRAIGIMDQIIATIRASKSKKDAANNLIKEYEFSDLQSEAILELMLYRLTGLEITAYEKEYRELNAKIKKLSGILKDEKKLMKAIKDELNYIKDKYITERRTEIISDDNEAQIDFEDIMIREDVVITLSSLGYIKRVNKNYYERYAFKVEDIDYREGDSLKFTLESNTANLIIFFTDKGRFFKFRCLDIPETKWKDKGDKLDSLIKSLNLSEEQILNIFSVKGGMKKYFQINTFGMVPYIINVEDLISCRNGKTILKLKSGEEITSIKLVNKY